MNTTLTRRSATDVIRGIAALGALLFLVIGVPAALLVVAGNPLPTSLPSLDELVTALTTPDDGSLFLAALALLGWAGWATFTAAVIVEIPAQLRGRSTPRLPALRVQQQAAGALVACIAVLVTAPGLVAPPPAHAAVATTVASTAAIEGEAEALTYLVRPGDTLWDIADRQFGDGARFAEIAALNYGVPQPGGGALDAGHRLEPGWVLSLPMVADVGAGVVTVERGDTLSGIAAEHLGAAGRYPEIAAATRGVVQPDGRQLTDPDLIYPGWQVHLPAEAQPAAPPAPPPQAPLSAGDEPAPPAPPPGVGEAPPDAPDPVPENATAAPDTPGMAELHDEGDADDGVAVSLATAAGLGTLTAAGLLVLLAHMRSRQQRHRRPGQRLLVPEAPAAATERALRATQDPLTVEHLDRALRHLARTLHDAGQPLPSLRLVRVLRDRLELHLANSSTAPAPFTALEDDDTVWVLHRDAVLGDDVDLSEAPSPYPALTVIGTDMDGGHILLDLEQVGVLAVQPADDTPNTGLLAALTVELATSTRAEDLQVTLVDACQDLPEVLGVDRVIHTRDLDRVLTELDVWATSLRLALADAGMDGPGQARAAHVVPDAWCPHIVLLGAEPTDAQRHRLRELALGDRRLPLAIVTTGARPLGEWILTYRLADNLATLEPAGLTLRPQTLPEPVYEQVLDVLRTAAAPVSAPAPLWTADDEAKEPSLKELKPNRSADVDSTNVLEANEANEANEDRPAPPSAPTILMLGTVEVTGARGELATRSHLPRLTEALAFLVLHPHRDHVLLDEALWPGDRVPEARRNQLISRARRWLGTAVDGTTFVPSFSRGGYRLAPGVETDWAQFCALVADSPATAPTASLVAALKLVRGQPFAGTSPRRYAWADVDRQAMISAIVDVAHEVSQRAQRNGDAAMARHAAAVGLLAEPGSEALWRDRLRAEWMAGNPAGIEEMADRLTVLSEELGDDLEPETVDLLDELLRRRPTSTVTTKPSAGGGTDGR